MKIDFEPTGKRSRTEGKTSLLICARQAGIGIGSVCGGKGTCGHCKIRVSQGVCTEPTSLEKRIFTPAQIAAGWRMACETVPLSDCSVYIPPESMTTAQRIQTEGVSTAIEINPAVIAREIKLSPPTLQDLQGDADRVMAALSTQSGVKARAVDYAALRQASNNLRQWEWKCQAVIRGNEIINVNPAASPLLGLAVDIGTTKIAGYLIDLKTGQTLTARGVMNPQIRYGEDIVTRMEHAVTTPEGAAQLQSEVIDGINGLIADLCGDKYHSEQIAAAVMVANTAVHHLTLGLPVNQLMRAPFIPAVAQQISIKARDIGVKIGHGSYIDFLPNVAGYVGADHVSFLLTIIGEGQPNVTSLAVDIGTNTEISLVRNGEIYSVSCASGPAFEGGHLSCGMRAADGAIERLKIIGDKVSFQTIGGAPPVGICGSATIDAMAEFRAAGIIDKSGRITVREPLSTDEGVPKCILSVDARPPVTITQKDIRELQLAKASIRAGIEVLIQSSGAAPGEIKQVILAGAFGNYISVSSAIAVGLLPDLPPESYKLVGNAAGAGARRALLSTEEWDRAEAIARRVHYVELASAPGFQDIFMRGTKIEPFRV